MKEFFEQLANLLEQHNIEMFPCSDADGCEQAIQFFRTDSDHPWLDMIELSDCVTHENLRDQIEREIIV